MNISCLYSKKKTIKTAGRLNRYRVQQADNVYSVDGLCPTICAHLQGQIGHQINILEEREDGED